MFFIKDDVICYLELVVCAHWDVRKPWNIYNKRTIFYSNENSEEFV